MDTKPSNTLNEEEIKANILLPHLASLNFTPDEILLERTFKIRLGRTEHIIGANKSNDTASGRLDFLCKKGEQNLFIIEAKSENVEISQEDIDQGVSYARLLDPIAPFVIVTNAKITRIIDSISKEDITDTDISTQSTFWANGCRISGDDTKLRFEALKNFIGYSTENIELFSRSQIMDRMHSLKGNNSQLEKKYIPELFVQDDSLLDYFSVFLESQHTCFAIIGESGVGKTNYICNLAETFSNRYISLFFNVQQLTDDLSGCIQNDFNWVFSSNCNIQDIIRRLNSIAESSKSRVCIFLDAIDESNSTDFIFDLDNFIRIIKSFPNIKLCITCKSSEWERFLVLKGNPSHLSESLFPIEHEYNSHNNQRSHYLISRFNDEELNGAISKYRNIYHFEGVIEGQIRNECKLGITLKVVSETYKNSSLPEHIDSIDVFRLFLEHKFSKIGNKDIFINILKRIGVLIVENKNAASKGLIEEELLMKSLDLRIDVSIPKELFTFNILTKVLSKCGNNLIGFYYTRLRDYVISILSYKLPELNDHEFEDILEKLMGIPVGQSALSWYADYANTSQYRIMRKQIISNALVFLKTYTNIIDNHFPNIKTLFYPQTLNRIGLAIYGKPGLSVFYGFIPLRDDDENIIKLLEYKGMDNNYIYKKLSTLGAKNVFLRMNDFTKIDPNAVAIDEIKNQLKDLVEKGMLNESKNKILALEKVINIWKKYKDIIEFRNISDQYITIIDKNIYPIKCSEIENKAKLFKAYSYFKYTENATSKHEILLKKANSALKFNNNIPYPHVVGDFPPINVLLNSISVIKDDSPIINENILPPPDKTIDYKKHSPTKTVTGDEYIFRNYSKEQLIKYIESFFTLFIQEYKIMIETCFPTFKEIFNYYSLIPLHLYIEVSEKENKWSLCYGYKKGDTGSTNIEVLYEPDNSILNIEKTDFKSICYSSLSDIFSCMNPFPLSQKYKPPILSQHCIIRNWVYGTIKEELKYLYKALDMSKNPTSFNSNKVANVDNL